VHSTDDSSFKQSKAVKSECISVTTIETAAHSHVAMLHPEVCQLFFDQQPAIRLTVEYVICNSIKQSTPTMKVINSLLFATVLIETVNTPFSRKAVQLMCSMLLAS
jgi:hypothetical protein